MLVKDIKDGTHFWGRLNNGEIAVFIKTLGSVYSCGPWEGDFDYHKIEFISEINKPTNENLYYHEC